ncbi:hypothetical protein RCL1_002655 [Eukaryota sp. TZLM3-RCL]
MTVSKDDDIFRDAIHLLDHNVGFNYIHWQLDCQWDCPMEETRPDFSDWVSRYNQGVSNLIDEWVRRLESGNQRVGVVPFIGLINTLMNGKDFSKIGLQCGVGHHSFTIGTKGNVLGCPVSWEDDWNHLGTIDELDCRSVKNKLNLENPCPDCPDLPICGGRCLFANKTKWWGDEGFDLVCSTVRHLIGEVKRVYPKILDLIDLGVVDREYFMYDAMDNSMEIIP